MPREHADLIEQAKGCPDIESALEHTFEELAARWKGAATRNDYGKGTAMGNQLAEDQTALVDAILGHSRVFKMPPKTPEERQTRLTGTPKTAERKYDKDGELINEEPVKVYEKPVYEKPIYNKDGKIAAKELVTKPYFAPAPTGA